jgi:hypothetical protein
VDINLNGKQAFPLTSTLEQLGIPFIYCGAYIDKMIDIYSEVASAVRVSKPVTIGKLRDAVRGVLKRRGL